MSDFLKSLAARQLGEAASVRPRLTGRFEPPPDAFAHEATRRAAGLEEPETDTLELSLEVETRAAPARDAAPRRVTQDDSRAREPRREPDETHARVVFAREQREESQPVLRQGQRTARDSEQTQDAPPPSNVTDSRTRERDEGDALARPKNNVTASDEETGLIRPDSRTSDRAPLVTRARVERDVPSTIEPREPPGREAVEAKRPSNDVRPATPPPPARREVAVTARAHDAESSSLRNESARERGRRREDADESHAARQARRARESSGTIEPRHAPRRERQAAARDAQRERAEVTPTINVTIGRVEVRATQGPPPAPRRAETAAPRMSLDDYLRRRRNGEVRE
ncbi:MAG TPA: hypothetical protein VKB12_15970 [Pyrinomonadaceae bacterium]|nr:hypothetical protein [Pyrinomonadaceae bacterium]